MWPIFLGVPVTTKSICSKCEVLKIIRIEKILFVRILTRVINSAAGNVIVIAGDCAVSGPASFFDTSPRSEASGSHLRPDTAAHDHHDLVDEVLRQRFRLLMNAEKYDHFFLKERALLLG